MNTWPACVLKVGADCSGKEWRCGFGAEMNSQEMKNRKIC